MFIGYYYMFVYNVYYVSLCQSRDHRDCMVIGFTTTDVISAYHH